MNRNSFKNPAGESAKNESVGATGKGRQIAPIKKIEYKWSAEINSPERWKRIVAMLVTRVFTYTKIDMDIEVSGDHFYKVAKEINDALPDEISLATEHLKNDMNIFGLFMIAGIRKDENEIKEAIRGLSGITNITHLTKVSWAVKRYAKLPNNEGKLKIDEILFTPLGNMPKLAMEVAIQEKSEGLGFYCSHGYLSEFGLEASKPLIDLLGSKRSWRALELMYCFNVDDKDKAKFAGHISKFMEDMTTQNHPAIGDYETISNLLQLIFTYCPDEATRRTALEYITKPQKDYCHCAPTCVPLHILDGAASSPYKDTAMLAIDYAHKLSPSGILDSQINPVLNSKIQEVRLHAFGIIEKEYDVRTRCQFLNILSSPVLQQDIFKLMLALFEEKFEKNPNGWAIEPLAWLAKYSQKKGMDAYLAVRDSLIENQYNGIFIEIMNNAVNQSVRQTAQKDMGLSKLN